MDRRKKDHYYLGHRLAGMVGVKRCQCLTYYDVANRADLFGAAPCSLDWLSGNAPRMALAVSILYDLTLNEQLAIDLAPAFVQEFVEQFPEHAWHLWAGHICTWIAGELHNDLCTRDEQRYRISELNGQKGGA